MLKEYNHKLDNAMDASGVEEEEVRQFHKTLIQTIAPKAKMDLISLRVERLEQFLGTLKPDDLRILAFDLVSLIDEHVELHRAVNMLTGIEDMMEKLGMSGSGDIVKIPYQPKKVA